MRTKEFDFVLPERLIAQRPPERRGASRLLHVRGYEWKDCLFTDLQDLVREHDVLVFNNTRVLKARLFGNKKSATPSVPARGTPPDTRLSGGLGAGCKDLCEAKLRNFLSAKADEEFTGGKVEVLIERLLDEHHALAQIRASHAPQPDSRLRLAGFLIVTVLGREGEFFRLRFDSEESVAALLERYGQLPLPPYITHAAGAEDEERYQTMFACQPGAVAAPTAGLHFDDDMFTALRARGAQIAYVTLHVGAGTFQPVRAEYTHEHVMHSERYTIPQVTVEAIRQAQAQGGRVIAVGTTSLRALESATQAGELQAGESETRIFITPGYRFKMVDTLITNFHLPKSTLLMLVCAFGGMEQMLAAYRHAVKNEYRFFSYGDAMLIERLDMAGITKS